ncbi:unnamed protein product, partial [Pylaiella littoralis]
MAELGGGGCGSGLLACQRRGGEEEEEGGGGAGLWNKSVTDRYLLLRPWTVSPHDHESELWWAKPRLSGSGGGGEGGSGSAVIIKTLAKGNREETGWETFVREWGVLKYLQEEGRLDGQEALNVGLVGAFEKERSLVLSIPAGSRTLREVGQQMHIERLKKRKKKLPDGVFLDQVESLAAQSCRAVCWLHRCGLIHGGVTPDHFVLLGGTGGGGAGGLYKGGENSIGTVALPAWAHGGAGAGGGGRSSTAVLCEGELRL